MNIYESAENYLEAILSLHERHGLVRSIDIANELHFSKPSVSVAMKKLREAHHIIVSPEGFITLTETGKEIADRIYERHTLLSSWLTQLGVDPEIASEDACRMEHVISAESFEAIKAHISKYQQ
mgnify:CR=1 FL=1